jgi:threonyl-tRNA synthetase
MAQVLEQMYPGVKLTLGPAISNGFYYDIDFEDQKITEADFKKIEDSILEISRGKHEFKLRPVSKADALELYKDNVYKTEMITNLEDGTITFCDHDTFTDLCRGGHIPNTGIIKAKKIMSCWSLLAMKKQTTNTCLWNFISKTKDLTEYLLYLKRQNVAIEN